MRIVGTAATPSEGLVQVYYNDMWRWVCDEKWDATDADVACQQLGYQSSSTTLSFPTSNRAQEHWTAWLNIVQCFGNESSILSCEHDGFLQKRTCATKRMAGMICSGSQGKILIVGVYDNWFSQIFLLGPSTIVIATILPLPTASLVDRLKSLT